MGRIKGLCRIVLERVGWLPKSHLVASFEDAHPDPERLTSGRLVIVRSGGLDKWVCFRCPGGCGEKLQLSLSQQRRPQWSISVDWLGRPSISPSIRQTNACRCHFLVKDGRVKWCWDSGHANGRSGRDRAGS
ncbi:DUF6527 family protein [Paracoccus sp. MKU1]|uniref:DUF6527 family protein n=1 Tax=Paracoccus sp. MKU1 TaxID=1745182 RepID=UPI0009EC821F|nr:DUF6527 family protein [Paracoccus sp. MKU1]